MEYVMEERIEDIIEQMEGLIKKGKDSYEVDQELKKFELSAKEKGYIISRLQEFEVDYIQRNTGKTSAFIRMILGVTILLIGYLGSFADYTSPTSRYIIKIGAILGGGIIAFTGYRQYRRIISTGEESKFRKKRFKRYE